jgi:hypothetical protein
MVRRREVGKMSSVKNVEMAMLSLDVDVKPTVSCPCLLCCRSLPEANPRMKTKVKTKQLKRRKGLTNERKSKNASVFRPFRILESQIGKSEMNELTDDLIGSERHSLSTLAPFFRRHLIILASPSTP